MMLYAEKCSISYKNKRFCNTNSSVGSIVHWYLTTVIISHYPEYEIKKKHIHTERLDSRQKL